MTGDGDIIYHEKYKNGILFKDLPEDEQRQFKDIFGFERDKVAWYRLFSSQPSKIILKELDNGMIFGIAVSRYQLAGPQIKLIRQMVSRSLIILVISVIIGVLWIRSIIRPLQKMTDVADRYASGDYSEQMVIDSKDEVGRLSRSL